MGSPTVPCPGKKKSSHRMLALPSPTAEARPLLASCETMWPEGRQTNQKCPQVSPMGYNLPEGVSLERAEASRQNIKLLSFGVDPERSEEVPLVTEGAVRVVKGKVDTIEHLQAHRYADHSADVVPVSGPHHVLTRFSVQ